MTRFILARLRIFAAALACAFFTCAAQAGPGNALRFDGTNDYVLTSSNAVLNAFPLTVSAWIRTTNQDGVVRGIVSKYADGTFSGWTMFTLSGHLHAWYFRDGSDSVYGGGEGLDAGFLADGAWHHVAFVVDPFNGRLFVDGVQKAIVGWAGTAGPTTTTQPVQIGRYFNFTTPFQGDIDEVTIWNQALNVDAVNYIKHRALGGKEDGLIALWHLDEGSGATTTADTGPNGFTGTLIGLPSWIPSTAPVVLQPVANSALKLSGTGSYVSTLANSDLNVLPLTITAWVKTSRNSANPDGIVSKYADASFSGYSLHLYNGHLRAWYFKDGSHYVWDGSEGLDGGFIADTNWHHVALVVDTNGGSVFVDGNQIQHLNWTGAAGPTVTAFPMEIGRYSTLANTWLGTIDEVAIWNASFTASQIQAQKNLRLNGNETNLRAYYRFDEASGEKVNDLTGNGHTGTFANPGWTGSIAYLGDGSEYILTTLDYGTYSRAWEIRNSPTFNSFQINAQTTLRHIYDFGSAPPSHSISVSIQPTMTDAASLNVPLTSAGYSNTVVLGSYNASSPPNTNGLVVIQAPVNFQPQSQLQSVSDTYSTAVALSHSTDGGAQTTDESETLALTELLDFDGNLLFGTTPTTFTSIANNPTPAGLSGGGVATQLAINNLSGALAFNPAYTFGNGTALNVILQDNGDAIVHSTNFENVIGPIPDMECVQNICFVRTNLTLSTNGFTGSILLQLPAGFGVSDSTTNRVTFSQLPFTSVPLDANLLPQAGSLTLPLPLWGAEETKPFWFFAPAITWNVAAGQIVMATTAVQFVRQLEDDVLTATTASLNEPNTARRVSNDAYYRNATFSPGSQAIITANANGAAQLSTTIILNPPELRPHFPYTTNTPGSQIVTGSGQLVISNDLVDVSNSSLNITGGVPLSYAADCTDTNCSGVTAGPTTLAFAPDTAGVLGFTPDGGLLSFGSVPVTSLKWGFAGNGQYAQTAGTVQTCVYEMAGTFLRADQTPITGPQAAAAMLFSGFADGANDNYIERPGLTNYPAGFANYAGLNFRTPATGQSLIANKLSAPYPLAANAKYYVRAGGVSGIHQAATFSSNLTLYGYPFTFTTYALSYLDSDNYESRTDGSLVLPVPAGFPQEFTRMKFLCSGGLDSAQLPSTSVVKHLVYWNADIVPKSIQFSSQTNETCSTANRYLVMGVQMSLPFIPQSFHATLGFKSTGNLLTLADGIAGVDSRFPVAGKLMLQGTGTSFFPLSAASDGYFNNWENPNRPTNGFFTFAGKLTTPFFGEVKVQLHVTPSFDPTAPQIALMGGWPSADGTGKDMGWSVNGSNYFNTSKFDPQQYGWPQSAGPVEKYRNPSNEVYRARAQRDWIEVAKFDYPLLWDSVLRRFEGFVDSPTGLPIIDVNSRLKEITPATVDLDFAQDLSVQVPGLKVLDFTDDALNELNGPLLSVSNALRQTLGGALKSSGITSGFSSLQTLLQEDATALFRPIAQPALKPVVTNLYALLAAETAKDGTNVQAVLASVHGYMTQVNSDMSSAIRAINGTANQANSVIGQVNNTLSNVDDTMTIFISVLNKDSDGNRHIVQTIVTNLVHDQGPLLNFTGTLADNVLQGLLTDVNPTLDEIQQDLTDLKSQFDDAKSQITSGTGSLSDAIGSVTNQTGSLQQFTIQAESGISNALAGVLTPAGDFFTADPAVAQQLLSDSLVTAFLSSPITGDYQTQFRQFFSDKSFLLDQLMDVLFDQINRAIRNALSDQIQGAQDSLFQNFKGVGLLSQSLLSAKIRGVPTFNHDSLKKIHLDADIKMMMPDEMKFSAFMDILELDSQTTNMGCIPPGAPAAEIVLGARNVPLQWDKVSTTPDGAGALTLDADARWTLQNGSVLGIGGTIDVHGGAQFSGVGIKDIGASFAIGELECYLACRATATVEVLPLVPVNFEAGFFAGHACSLDPLIYVDPDVTNVLDASKPFTGVYIQYGGSVSLSQILFGEHDCFLDVEANVSTQEYLNGGAGSTIIGIRQKEGVDVSLICLIQGSAEFTMAASGGITPDGPQLNLLGSADFCGSAGPCPLCVSGCKTFTLSGQLTPRGITYHFDY